MLDMVALSDTKIEDLRLKTKQLNHQLTLKEKQNADDQQNILLTSINLIL